MIIAAAKPRHARHPSLTDNGIILSMDRYQAFGGGGRRSQEVEAFYAAENPKIEGE